MEIAGLWIGCFDIFQVIGSIREGIFKEFRKFKRIFYSFGGIFRHIMHIWKASNVDSS